MNEIGFLYIHMSFKRTSKLIAFIERPHSFRTQCDETSHFAKSLKKCIKPSILRAMLAKNCYPFSFLRVKVQVNDYRITNMVHLFLHIKM